MSFLTQIFRQTQIWSFLTQIWSFLTQLFRRTQICPFWHKLLKSLPTYGGGGDTCAQVRPWFSPQITHGDHFQAIWKCLKLSPKFVRDYFWKFKLTMHSKCCSIDHIHIFNKLGFLWGSGPPNRNLCFLKIDLIFVENLQIHGLKILKKFEAP